MAKTNYDPPELIEAAKNGDPEAQNELVARNLGLLRSMAGRIVGYERADEFLSFASHGYLRAVARFDPKFGTKLSTFTAQGVMYAVLTEYRRLKAYAKAYRRPTLTHLGHDVADSRKRAPLSDIKDLHRYISFLPDRRRYVVNARLAGIKFKRLALALGVTKARVQQIEKQAHRQLRSMWMDESPRAKVA